MKAGEGEGAIVLRESGFMVRIRDYDNTAYEEQLFYFNTRQRCALYPHEVVDGEGLDHCYDCTAEVYILGEYCTQVLGMASTSEHERAAVAEHVAVLSKEISRSITRNRTLLDGNSNPGQRQNGIQQRQWINNKPAYKNAHEIRAKEMASGNAPRLLVDGGADNPLMISNDSSSPGGGSSRRIAHSPSRGPVAVHKVSGTTLDNPLANRWRALLQRKSTTFELPEGAEFKSRQRKTSSSGWARCVLHGGVVVYVHDEKKLVTKEAPSVDGWTIRVEESLLVGACVDESTGQQLEARSFYENTLTGDTSVDVPEPLVEED